MDRYGGYACRRRQHDRYASLKKKNRKVGKVRSVALETLKSGRPPPDSQACLFDLAMARKHALDPPGRARRGVRSDDFTIFSLTLSRRFAEL
jgi:hypothetical protein